MSRPIPREVAEFVKWCEDRDIWPKKEHYTEDRRLIDEETMTWIEVMWYWVEGK